MDVINEKYKKKNFIKITVRYQSAAGRGVSEHATDYQSGGGGGQSYSRRNNPCEGDGGGGESPYVKMYELRVVLRTPFPARPPPPPVIRTPTAETTDRYKYNRRRF